MADYPIYRLVKGSQLSFTEMDDNLRWLSANMSASHVTITGSLVDILGTVSVLGDLTVTGTASVGFLNYEGFSSGSNQIGDDTSDAQTLIGTVKVSGSFNLTGSANIPDLTGSLYGTSSWAENFITGSVTSASYAFTASSAITSDTANSATSASYAFTASSAMSAFQSVSSSYAFTASSAIDSNTANNATSASYAFTASSTINSTNALTASSADNFIVRNSLTASAALVNGTITAQTLIVQTVTSSVVYSSGSNIFGNDLTNQQILTGSVSMTGSLTVNGSTTINTTTGVFLPPRMTQTQRTALGTPTVGSMVYQTDGTEGVYVYTSTGWRSLTMV